MSTFGSSSKDDLHVATTSNEGNKDGWSINSARNHHIYKTYTSRYYVLMIFSVMLFFQCMVWDTWGPISASVLAAYPSWTKGTIANMANCAPVMTAIFVLPTSWAIDKWGLRPTVVVMAGLVAVGHGLRCVSQEEDTFTIMSYLCALFNGLQGTLLLATCMIPALWFPAEQRVTATAISGLVNQMGTGGSYLEPLIVEDPSNSSGNISHTEMLDIRQDIHTLMFIELGIALALFFSLLVYFPSAPPTPPSPSSGVQHLSVTSGFRQIARNWTMWQLMISYAVFTGVSMVWLGVMNFSLSELGIDQKEAQWLGIINSVFTGVVCLFTSRLVDIFYGKLKMVLLILMTICSLSYIWFMLLSLNVIHSTKAQVYITVLAGHASNFATTPLFLELTVETAYPSPEAGVNAFTWMLNNLMATIFLALFYIPTIRDANSQWMTYVLVGSTTGTLLPVLFVKEQYKRSELDREGLKT